MSAEDEALKDLDTIPYRSVMSDPDGPEIEVPYLGTVKTFLSENRDADRGPHVSKFSAKVLPNLPRLMHHVPLDKRGPYKEPPEGFLMGERTGAGRYALCNGITSKLNQSGEPGRLCKAKAINYSGYCSRHGGMLNPADRQRIDWDRAPRDIKFKYGFLKAEDLDDEELARGQIRNDDGTWTKNKFVSAEIYAEFKNRLFERGDVLLREAYIDAVKTFAEISKGTAYEPADRLKAAEFIFTRLRGKLPDVVELRADKPFENIMMKMIGGSREESRARRGFDEETAEITDYIDAEVVEELREYAGNGDFLMSEDQAEEAFTDEGDVKPGAVIDEQDRWSDDLIPDTHTWYGSAGAPTKDIPQDPDIRGHYERENDILREQKKQEEAKLLRKAHRERVRSALKTRKWSQNEGRANVPKAARLVVSEDRYYEEFENEVTIRLEKDW